jgi:hypothetical protein
VAGPLQDEQLGAGDLSFQREGVAEGEHRVLFAVDHKCRGVDLADPAAEGLAHIHGEVVYLARRDVGGTIDVVNYEVPHSRLIEMTRTARKHPQHAEDEVARKEPPRGVACPLVWRDDARATPAGNIAATEFVLRRIAQLRRDGYTREARALRPLLPERLEWRRWTGTLTDRDRRLIAEAETLAAAAREMIEQGGVLPFSEGADM